MEVFFNVSWKEQREIISEIKKYRCGNINVQFQKLQMQFFPCYDDSVPFSLNILYSLLACSKDSISIGFEHREKYKVAIKPGMTEAELESDDIIKGDYARVAQLNMNNVAVISTIMSQTVALDYYNVTVEELLEALEQINENVRKNGRIANYEKEALFKVVAQSNSIFNDMLTKVRVKERSDTAWNNAQYDRVYEGMKEEFELDERFSHVVFKLNLIQQNGE